MMKHYLGVDVGSISTKGVIIDESNNIAAESYIWTEGDPINAIKTLIGNLSGGGKYKIFGVGTTGSARKLAGEMLGAGVIKNEITAHAVGTLSVHPDAATILEIGGQDSKIIIIEDGIVADYAMNTLCAAGTGSFLASQALRLGVAVEHFGALALEARNPASIAARCTVFAESDLVHKAQIGYKKEDIIAGLCAAVANNFLNNLAKGKTIRPPVIFQGGVSRNAGVVKAFECALGQKIIVDTNGHLMGALGAAILAKSAANALPDGGKTFDFAAALNQKFETRGAECRKCENRCELIFVYRDDKLIDTWGKICEGVR